MTPRDEAIHSNLIFRRLKNTLGANMTTPVEEATGRCKCACGCKGKAMEDSGICYSCSLNVHDQEHMGNLSIEEHLAIHLRTPNQDTDHRH